MASPLNEYTQSLKETEILRSLEAVRDAESRLNKMLEASGRPTLPPFFYSREAFAALKRAHAHELAKLTPKEEPHWLDEWRASRGKGGAEPVQTPTYNVAHTVDLIRAAVFDKRISDASLRGWLRAITLLGKSYKIEPARARSIKEVLDLLAADSSWIEDDEPTGEAELQRRAKSPKLGDSPPQPAPPEPMTDDERRATSELIKRSGAIARGEVVELPTASARRSRNENDPEKPL